MKPHDQVLILFGATGDLAKRKLLPGLFHLHLAGLMPGEYRIIGSAPPDVAPSTDEFRGYVRDQLAEFGRHEVTDENWGPFADRLSFAPASDDDGSELKDAVERAERDLGDDVRRLVYLSVPPSAVGPMVGMLGQTNLSQRASVIIEKPFGIDYKSARHLNATLHSVFDESHIFRIDHFLGKEAAQNILALRFANGLFEPVWNRDHIAYVQIDVPEELTIEGRASFYEGTGAFRDMVVTHLFQVLGFTAMEPPVRFDAMSLRSEKTKLFDTMAKLDPSRVVFGQYEGYKEEPGVAEDSHVETFVALEARVQNWRWKGVPFYLRTGKALAEGRRTVTVGFHDAPLQMFRVDPDFAVRDGVNELVLELSDPGWIELRFMAKEPGARLELQPAQLKFSYGDSFTQSAGLEAYERLIHDAMVGDRTLFNSADGVERLWQVSEPLLKSPPKPEPYARGSWGPEAIEKLVAPNRWHLPD